MNFSKIEILGPAWFLKKSMKTFYRKLLEINLLVQDFAIAQNIF